MGSVLEVQRLSLVPKHSYSTIHVDRSSSTSYPTKRLGPTQRQTQESNPFITRVPSIWQYLPGHRTQAHTDERHTLTAKRDQVEPLRVYYGIHAAQFPPV